ncbi:MULTISPECIES: phasin family protein [unclassified Massilia]|uniref:phasin family protein n=1 Tax=unclassified Massilia TaxID=2609279 RepID=UPI001782CBDB|nr:MULTISPECIES: phasin family protein [unclassified Massilia]MBD8529808.1 phasin family protein [Massilia sp. CFBP 13647]MBD8672180.1 phasin family protein [Massilia sp. CFBP 13721]
MTSLPEQFSAARLTQLDNGFNLMRSFGDQALDQTSRVVALQLNASRSAIEQSSAALRQLLAIRDPRDLLAFGSQSQQQLRSMLDYGNELFSIAAGFTPLRSYSADALNAITTANAAAAQQTVDAAVASMTPSLPVAEPEAVAPAAEAEPAPASAPVSAVPFNAPVAEPESLPSIEIVTSDVAPTVAPTAIALAASEITDMSVEPPHPVAASVPVEVSVEIELPKVEPVDATPPVVVPATTKVTEIRGTKGRRKQP